MLHPLVALGPTAAPSEETRGRFSKHFGEAPVGAALGPKAPRTAPFSKQTVAPRLGLESVLLSFGLSSREEAEALGRLALRDKASADGTDPEAD